MSLGRAGASLYGPKLLLLVTLALAPLLLTRAASAQFIYVANTGEDTLSKVDVTTGKEVAKYRTWFGSGWPLATHSNGVGAAPSRIAVDHQGNVYVLNRHFSGGHEPVLLKIAPSGGTPTSSHLDTSGIIGDTPGELLDLPDSNSSNQIDDSTELKDKRIVWTARIRDPGLPLTAPPLGTLGRALCIAPSGNLWVGVFDYLDPITPPTKNHGAYYEVRATDGVILQGPIKTFVPGSPPKYHHPYGCVVDRQGRLWSASASTNLAEIDTNATPPTVAIHDHSALGANYGISQGTGCNSDDKVYLGSQNGKSFIVYHKNGTFTAPATSQFDALAVAVDQNGDIVVGRNQGGPQGGVMKFAPNGAVIWPTVPLGSLPGNAQPGTVNGHIRGIIIDSNNDIWAVHLFDDKVSKYRGSDGFPQGVFSVGRLPYTYGNTPISECPCAEVVGTGIECKGQGGTYDYSFTFLNQSPFSAPAGGLVLTPGPNVTNLTPMSIQFTPSVPPGGSHQVTGQFTVASGQPGDVVCLQLALEGVVKPGTEVPQWCCPDQSVCFQLPACPCLRVVPKFKCRKNGTWYLELTLVNSGPGAAASVEVFSSTPGVTVVPSTQPVNLPSPGTTTIAVNLVGATANQPIDLTINLHGPLDPATGVYRLCCTQKLRVTYPSHLCHIILDGDIFEDLNQNGQREPLEPALVGWTVSLSGEGDRIWTAQSDESGRYGYEDLAAGAYRLTVTVPEGWQPSQRLPRSVTVRAGDDRTAERIDLGFYRARP